MLGKGGGDDAVDDLGAAGVIEVAQQPLRFGADVVDLPGGAGFGDVGQHGGGLLAHPLAGDGGAPPPGGLAGDVGDELGQFALAAHDFDRLGAPGVALLCQRARFVFGLPCFQGGLLGDRQHFHDRRFAAVFGLKRLGQLADTMLDRRAARGPQLGQFGGDAKDFTHRPLTGCGVGSVGERHPDTLDQQRLAAGVVQLGGGHGGLV